MRPRGAKGSELKVVKSEREAKERGDSWRQERVGRGRVVESKEIEFEEG